MFELDVAYEMSAIEIAEDEERCNESLGYFVGEAVVVENHERYGDWQLNGGTTLKTPEAFMEIVKEMGDSKPMFANYVLPSGFSRILTPDDSGFNEPKHRYWPPELFKELANKINTLGSEGSGLPGYKGHAASYEMNQLPNPAVLWIAAENATNVQNGAHAVIARAYVYDHDNNRDYVKTGAFSSSSVSAIIRSKPQEMQGEEVVVIEQANFLSVDLVRKGMEGIKGTEKISVEGASMLTPEMLKLLATLNADQIKEHCPKAASELASVQGNVAAETSQLINKLQEKTEQNAELTFDATMAQKIAEELGCKTSELSSFVADYMTVQKDGIKAASETALNGIKNEQIRKVVAKRLASTVIKTVSEVAKIVETAHNEAKELIAELGFELGGVDENAQSSDTNFSVASLSMQKKLTREE